MKKASIYLMVVGLLSSVAVSAQDTIKVTNEFLFENGLYYSYESFQKNTPDLKWKAVQYEAHPNKEKRSIQFKNINLVDANNERTKLDITKLWGISVNGIPYIRVFIESRGISEFVALRTRGRICYFNYEGYIKKLVPMTIYDRQTGEPVFKQDVENKVLTSFEKLLRFEDGAIVDFNLQNFTEWIAETDKRLGDTLKEMNKGLAEERLYKSMKIFNDRNPVFIKK
ncbi:MAG: hypothetical protein ACPG19_13535 [Saprospiraceae bacterium]